MVGRERSATLVEMLVVAVLLAILMLVALGFHQRARAQTADVAARSNIRAALPAIEAYRQDTGSYGSMTLAALQGYSPGLGGIEIVSANAVGYCVRTTVAERTWSKSGSGGPIARKSCV